MLSGKTCIVPDLFKRESGMAQVLVDRELTEEGPRRLDGVRPGSGRGAVRSVKVNLAESPITWLHARGHLDDRQFAAGERLRADWERAELAPSVTMRWDPVRIAGGEPGLTQGERQLAARRRFEGAIAAAGPGLSDILWRVVWYFWWLCDDHVWHGHGEQRRLAAPDRRCGHCWCERRRGVEHGRVQQGRRRRHLHRLGC
jgi:hypothetical protein